ncbi:MAG: hypothetical protein ABI862_13855 [Ilumatobacteraceae bacterium]
MAGSAVANTATTAVAAAGAPGDTIAVKTTTTVAAAPALAPVDGAAVLQQAIAATGGGYHFNQTATLDGAVALTIDGDRLPDGARLAVRGESGLVNYIFTTTGVYLMPESGEWEADDSAAPAVDPINAIAAPTSVAVASNDGTTLQLVVTVPVGSIGLSGEGDASLQVAVVSGALSSISYSATTADGKAAATTVLFSAVVDPSPVVAPI